MRQLLLPVSTLLAGISMPTFLLETLKDVDNPPRILILESSSPQAGGSAQDFQGDCGSFHCEQEGRRPLLQDHPQVTRGHQSRARGQRGLYVQVLWPARAYQRDPEGCNFNCQEGK